MEKVDILEPPTFRKSGVVKTREQAWNDEDWIATFNLWVIQDKPVPSVVYQQRSPKSSWAPNKLDVTAGGHLSAGEEISDGLREVEEELGKRYKTSDLSFLGRKINISPDVKGRIRHNIVYVYVLVDNSPLDSYELEKKEVFAICSCPIKDLIKVHTEKNYDFNVKAIDNTGRKLDLEVHKGSFPYNWDGYHLKIALLADRFMKGEKNIIY